MKCRLFFLFLCGFVSVDAAYISDKVLAGFKTRVFELEHSQNHKHLVIFDSDYTNSGLSNYVAMLRALRKDSNDQCKIDLLIEADTIFKILPTALFSSNISLTMETLIADNILHPQEKKGVIVYFTNKKDDSFFEVLTEKIKALQEKNWRVYIQSHSRDFSQKLRDWQKERGSDATMTYTSIWIKSSNFYTSVGIIAIVCVGLWIYHFIAHK